MPIATPKDFIETYRLKAGLRDLHELTGRGPFKEATRFIVQRIAGALETGQSDTVVDVGCGDGALLVFLAGSIARGVGISGSDEEAARLGDAHGGFANLKFIRSLASQIELPDRLADRVVCNSVFHFLPTRQHMLDAIREFARIAKPGARVFIGEVPFLDEQLALKGHSTLLRRLLGKLKYNLRAPPRDLAQRALGYLRARLSKGELFIIHPKKTIYLEAGELTAFAATVGLDLIFQRRHVTLDSAGNQVESQSRMDYLFGKRATGS